MYFFLKQKYFFNKKILPPPFSTFTRRCTLLVVIKWMYRVVKWRLHLEVQSPTISPSGLLYNTAGRFRVQPSSRLLFNTTGRYRVKPYSRLLFNTPGRYRVQPSSRLLFNTPGRYRVQPSSRLLFNTPGRYRVQANFWTAIKHARSVQSPANF